MTSLSRLRRLALPALLIAAAAPGAVRAADPAPFDLTGPDLRIRVTRGTATLPIAEVPELAAGDTIRVEADLPADQRARFILVSAFLSGATNPPPRDWIRSAETWKTKEKDRVLTLTVPAGARQLAVFLVPETGSAEGTIASAVRGKPGEFVRATQAINRASLDRSRLNAFVAAIRSEEDDDPAHLKRVAPTLAKSLAIKLNGDCLDKVVEYQVACLLENRESLVLNDVHSSSLAETIAGAPTNLALQLSYTREAGFGYYSQYIAVVRDIARLFGAFSNPQFRYLPALGLRGGDRLSLLLDTAPSFAKPRSVIVAPMPAIGGDSPPRLRAASDAPLCGADPALTLPVEGAPLIYSTDFAREMALVAGGQRVAVRARTDRGGYVVAAPLTGTGTVEGRIDGHWGFEPLTGPAFRLQFPDGKGWTAAEDATLVVGRDNMLELRGAAPACIVAATMRVGDGPVRDVTFKPQGDGRLALTLPLTDAKAGRVSVELRETGAAAPTTLTLRAYREASRIEGVAVHAGDTSAELTGQRLDLVERVEIGDLRATPQTLTRAGKTDRLTLIGAGTAPAAGSATGRVILSDGRTLTVPVTVRPPRIAAALIDGSVRVEGTSPFTPVEPGEPLLPAGATLRFAVRASTGDLAPTDTIEIAGPAGQTARLVAGPQLQLQGKDVLVAALDPAALGPSAFGPLRFRLVRGSEASDWRPLATLVRLPRLQPVECDTKARCTLRGEDLFLIEAVAPTRAFTDAVAVPDGFTGPAIEVARPADGALYLRLRDAPGRIVALPAK